MSKFKKTPTQTTRDAINSLGGAITALSKASQQLSTINNELSGKATTLWSSTHALQGAAIETLRKLQETESKPILSEPPTRNPFVPK